MSFPDSETIANAECLRIDPPEFTHDKDCPLYPSNYVIEFFQICECDHIHEAYAFDAAESRLDFEREGV